jgi:hypothetical protein
MKALQTSSHSQARDAEQKLLALSGEAEAARTQLSLRAERVEELEAALRAMTEKLTAAKQKYTDQRAENFNLEKSAVGIRRAVVVWSFRVLLSARNIMTKIRVQWRWRRN